MLDFGGEGGFEGLGIGFGVEMDFAGGDLLGGGAAEAELANAEAPFHPQWRAEDAASHGARGVEVAESGGGVESGTGLVIGEVFEESGTGFVKQASAGISGEIGSDAREGLLGAPADGCGALRIGRVEGGEAFTQAGGVELGDGEYADAALGASGSAFEPSAGAAGSVGNGGVDDLDELGVAGREHAVRIVECGCDGAVSEGGQR